MSNKINQHKSDSTKNTQATNSIDFEKEPKQDELLIRIAIKQCKFFHDDQGEAYARVKVKTHIEIWNLTSGGFKDWIAHQLWIQHKKGLVKSSYDAALIALRGMAIYEGSSEEVFLRVAQIKNIIYIDMCDKKWRAIRIDKHGWGLIGTSPVAFIRSKNMRSLQEPSKQGNINLLRKHINIQEKDFILVVSWLLMSMQAGTGAYPMMVLRGSAGCGKTTTSRMLRELIDPNKAGLLSKPKTDELRVIGVNNHVLAFDNLSGISSNQSDALCKISTGDNQTIRKLYTTNDEFTVSLKKPIILNGIDEIAKRSDLVSRSIKIELIKLEESKSESFVWDTFIKDAPLILGALLDGLTVGLKNIDNIKVNSLLRMGDFCKFSSAASFAYKWREGVFMSAYQKNIEQSYIDAIESSIFATALIEMFEYTDEFKGTPKELLDLLSYSYVDDKLKNTSKWIKTPKGVTEQLSRYEDALKILGITIDKYRDRTNKTILKIIKDSKTYKKALNNEFVTNEQWLKDMG